MAKVGLEYVCSGILGSNGTHTNGKAWGPASTFNGAPTVSNVKDYGDDGVAETDTSVTGGTVSVELNESTLELKSNLLGHTYDETDKEMISKDTDIAPFVGIAAIGKSKRNNALVYTGKFYPKVQFKEPSDENATRQENTAFTHTTLEGDLYKLDDGTWKEEKEFATLALAKTWANGKVGIVTTP